MANTQTSLSSAFENLRKSAEGFFKAFKIAIREIIKTIVSWFERNIRPLISFMKKYERDIGRHKHNQHTRSTWKMQWDSRRQHQITNRKPNFAVARRNC